MDPSPTYVGFHNSIAVDPEGNVLVAYHEGTPGQLRFARRSGGAWTLEMVDADTSNAGLYTSIALDAQANPSITYWDFTNGNLKFATKSGGAWDVQTIDASPNDVGGFTSLVIDGAGEPHVSYYDWTAGDALYARKSGSVWLMEVVDGASADAGSYASMDFDAAGRPHICYYDLTNGDLLIASLASATGVDATGASSLFLAAYPNPVSSGSVSVSFRATPGIQMQLAVYDVTGRLVRSLAHGATGASAGSAYWDARDSAGRLVSPGTYFLRVEAAGDIATRKLVVVR